MSSETPVSGPPPKSFQGLGAVVIFVGIAVMISLVWTQFQQAQRRGGQLLEVHGGLGTFSFLDALSGQEETLPASDGNFRVLAALSTAEGGVAPMLMARLRELENHLDRMQEKRVRLVVITLDPENDTPEVLTVFARAAGADSARWSFLTSPHPGLHDWIVGELFGPLLGEGEPFPAAPTRILLLDPEGNIRAYRDAQNPGVAGNLLHDLGALDREFPPASTTGSKAD
jgi:protein SCO1/2